MRFVGLENKNVSPLSVKKTAKSEKTKKTKSGEADAKESDKL